MRKLILSLAAVSLVLFAEKALCRGTTFAIEPLSLNSHEYQDFRVKEAEPRTRGTGRFLSVDPVLDVNRHLHKPQGWNRYSYVENNPINAVDRTGRYIESPIDIAVLLFDVGMGIYETYKTGEVSNVTKAALAADLLTLATPGAAGGGAFVRGGAMAARSSAVLQTGARLTQVGTKLNQAAAMSQNQGSSGSSGSASEPEVDVNKLKRLSDKDIKKLGGEELTRELKAYTGKSKANLYLDRETGRVYSVTKGGEPQWVHTIDR